MNTQQEWNLETQQQYNKIKQEYDHYQNSIFHYKEYCIECKSQNKKPLHPSELIQKRDELWSDYYPLIILKRKTNPENDNQQTKQKKSVRKKQTDKIVGGLDAWLK